MYLAKHVGGWSTPQIGRFYNGRHHTTVLHAIQKIELLRSRDESVNALLEVLTFAVNPKCEGSRSERPEPEWNGFMIDAIAARVIDKPIEMPGKADVTVDFVEGGLSSGANCRRGRWTGTTVETLSGWLLSRPPHRRSEPTPRPRRG
jgi:hypothetical protein